MKKLFAIILALAMIFAMSATAFATTLTIDEDRDYEGYRLLNLTTSEKDCGHGDDEEHVDTCYNYAYTVNPDYQAVLAAVSGEANDEDIIAWLTTQTEANGELKREVADALYAEIKAESIDTDFTTEENVAPYTIAQGYWLFADVTNLAGANAANSLVIVNTAGMEALTIAAKTGLPTVTKKVQDKNDSTGETSGWQDSADFDIGDEISFQLTATMPDKFANYDEYKVVFHDTLSAGLTLDVASIKVFADGEDITDAVNGFDYAAGENGKFTISCDDVKDIEDVTVTKDTVFVVTYNATLNEDAVIGAAGNTNKVQLEFSNNPYDTTATGKTQEDTVIVFTYQLVINKVDGNTDAPLNGATFVLKKLNAATSVYEEVALTENNGNAFVWEGLDDGKYQLVEEVPPAGYNKMADLYFDITAEHTQDPAELALQTLNGGAGTDTIDLAEGSIEKNIANFSGTVLPETGAEGTFFLITGGAMLVAVACVFMITRKKMSIYED